MVIRPWSVVSGGTFDLRASIPRVLRGCAPTCTGVCGARGAVLWESARRNSLGANSPSSGERGVRRGVDGGWSGGGANLEFWRDSWAGRREQVGTEASEVSEAGERCVCARSAAAGGQVIAGGARGRRVVVKSCVPFVRPLFVHNRPFWHGPGVTSWCESTTSRRSSAVTHLLSDIAQNETTRPPSPPESSCRPQSQ